MSRGAGVPERHPLRSIGAVVDQAVATLHAKFEARYSHAGRPSPPPE
jgi:transposase